jgi:hypothetical protein
MVAGGRRTHSIGRQGTRGHGMPVGAVRRRAYSSDGGVAVKCVEKDGQVAAGHGGARIEEKDSVER